MTDPPMLTFTSARERRLWTWVGLALVAIWSTLGLARTLAGELVERDAVDGAMFTGFLVVVAATIVYGLRKRPDAVGFAAALGLGALYFMALMRIASPAERTHLIEYGIVALLIHAALTERRRNGGAVRRPGPLAVLATALLGAVDELLQGVIPGRVFDPVDLAFNAFAAVLVIGASSALTFLRGRLGARGGGSATGTHGA